MLLRHVLGSEALLQSKSWELLLLRLREESTESR
jgi:hypothetical protein